MKTSKGIIKRLFTTVLIMALISVILSGCAGKTAKNPSVKEIDEKIKQTVDVSSMRQGDESKLKKLYDINADEVEEFVLYMAPSNIKADEITVIKVKDANNVSAIKDKIAARIQKQGESFKDYLPEEYYLIENHVLDCQGNYVILAVSKDAEKIHEAFNGFFK